MYGSRHWSFSRYLLFPLPLPPLPITPVELLLQLSQIFPLSRVFRDILSSPRHLLADYCYPRTLTFPRLEKKNLPRRGCTTTTLRPPSSTKTSSTHPSRDSPAKFSHLTLVLHARTNHTPTLNRVGCFWSVAPVHCTAAAPILK